MAKRLVITNGEWTTRHEIGEAAIVIGRDPNCDLFFVNQKLSRRHARVEPGSEGVKLIDLGSRNGIWVNGKMVDEHLLAPGDAIWLGGLRIVYEEDAVEPTLTPAEMDATVMLPTESAAETIQRETDPESESAEPGGSDATVLLPGTPADKDRTVMLSDAAPSPDDSAATVILGAESESVPDDASTRSFSSDETKTLEGEERILIPEPEPIATRVREWVARVVERRAKAIGEARRRAAALPWQTKFTLLLSGLGYLLYAALVLPLINVGSVALLLFVGLAFIAVWTYVAVLLARKLTLGPVANLRRDVEAVLKGEKDDVPAAREYREVGELAESINRLTRNEPSPESTMPRQESPESDEAKAE